ncbi:MAG: hypothetical protein ACOYIG_13360, partial [Acetivibrionales bacterium]
SDLVTDSMAALGLEISDMDSYMDMMARTSQKSNTDVQQLGEGILVAGVFCQLEMHQNDKKSAAP